MCTITKHYLKFFRENGKSSSKMEALWIKDWRVFKPLIVIDGMLKNNTSETNFSLKCLKVWTKGAQNLNLILLMILMHKNLFVLFPRKYADYTAFRDFLRTYKIKNGFLILDRGFDDKECKNLMREKILNI